MKVFKMNVIANVNDAPYENLSGHFVLNEENNSIKGCTENGWVYGYYNRMTNQLNFVKISQQFSSPLLYNVHDVAKEGSIKMYSNIHHDFCSCDCIKQSAKISVVEVVENADALSVETEKRFTSGMNSLSILDLITLHIVTKLLIRDYQF